MRLSYHGSRYAGWVLFRLAPAEHPGDAMAVLEKAGNGDDKKGEQEAGDGDPVAGEPVAAALAKTLRQFLPGRLFVVQDAVRAGIGLVDQAAPF